MLFILVAKVWKAFANSEREETTTDDIASQPQIAEHFRANKLIPLM